MSLPGKPDSGKPDSQLKTLIAAYLDGRLKDDEWAILRQRLHKERSARDYFRSMTELHATLLGDSLGAGASLARQDLAELERNEKPVVAFPVARRKAIAGLAAAACLVLGLSAWWWQSPANEVILTQVVGAVFQSGTPELGDPLRDRSIQLESGLVELSFPRCEASVLIEAPASFRVVDEQTLWLESGRLTADVQNGDEQGLRVLTSDSDVLDRGTRFAVDVVEGRGSEVHVFEGEVAAATRSGESSGPARSLVEGEALRLGTSGAVTERELRRATFIHTDELRRLENGWTEERREKWNSAADRMRADEALLAFVDFSAADELAMGRNEGAREVQGRFPGTTSLEFLDEGDHVRVDLDAVTDQLTLMAWVRLDRNATGVNSIYHTDNWKTPGQVHWMVAEGKQMRLALFGQTLLDARGWPESERTIIEELGRWVHLASVYDARTGTVRFFVDGQFDSEVILDESPSAVLGPAQIGNWSTNNPRYGDRRLSGRLDELVILTRTLSDEEIAAWQEAGSPY